MLQEEDEVVAKITSYDRIMSENVDVRTQLKAVELERKKLSHEVDRVSYYISMTLSKQR